jgi:UDP:flavonoid glycosyltransferase YjiC (YdhE family)
MRVVFATFGSLGDLHPYIALARGLARRGHEPVIATFEAFRYAVEEAGVAFAAMRPSMDGFGDRAAVMRRLVDPWRGPEVLVREMFMPHVRESYADLERAAAGADLLVNHPLVFAGPLLAEKRGLPWASTVLAPLSLFSALDPPVFPGAPWLRSVRALGPGAYRLVFRIPRLMMRRWEAPLYALRRDLGLPSPGPLAQMEGQYSPALNLALFSGVLAGPQPDWPPNTVICGFPRYDGPPPDPATQATLNAFLAAGEPPLVFALGSSAVLVADDFWRHAIAAARLLGRRALLVTGAPPEELGALPPSVGVFRYLPYSSVFPRACAIVHPGGIGTLAQALAAGRPQLVVPVAFDQPDNARRAVALGAARSIPFRKVTAATLARELRRLLENPGHAGAATSAARAIGAENAAERACDALLGNVAHTG